MSDCDAAATAEGGATGVVVAPQPPPLRDSPPGTAADPIHPHAAATASAQGEHASLATSPSPAAAPGADEGVQMVADLKGELYHATRSLLQVRQQARTSEETCAELRQRCQALEAEKHALQRELQEAQERQQARQSRLDEHRREAADAKLAVVSLTAERDELAARLQEAWNRVAEMGVTLREREARATQLEADVTAARHGAELVTQQRSHVEEQLRLLQERLRVQETDGSLAGAARQRLLTSLQAALQQLAGLLSGVAYDYQQSLALDETEDEASAPEGADGVVASITAAASPTAHTNATAAPHVVLSPANTAGAAAQPHASADDARVRRRGVTHAEGRGGGEAARLRAEGALHDADVALFGGAWAPAAALSPSSSPEHSAESASSAAGTTPPERRPSTTWQALVQSQRWGVAHAPSNAKDCDVAEEAVRTAVTPVLLALKHVGAMLSTLRLERRRWTAERAHLRRRCAALQRELETAQRSGVVREGEAADVRGRLAAVQRRAEQAETALLECRQEDARRRSALAQALDCLDDWALVQHSVQLLRVRQAELHKDVDQLEAQQRSAPPSPHAGGGRTAHDEGGARDAERAALSAQSAAAAEARYQQLEQQYRALKEWVETRWSAAAATAAPAHRDEASVAPAAPPPPSPTMSAAAAKRPPAELDSPPPVSKPARVPTSGAVTTPPRSPAAAATAAAAPSRSSSAWLHRSSIPPPPPVPATALVDSPVASHVRDARHGPYTGKEVRVAPAAAGQVGPAGSARSGPVHSPAASTSASSLSSASDGHETGAEAEAQHGGRAPYSREGIARAAADAGSAQARHPPRRLSGVATASVSFPPPPPLSVTYSAPLPGSAYPASRPAMNGAASLDAEQALLASLYRDQARARVGAAATSPEVRNPYGAEAVDYASLFATEVLHVIEALDRRVSGALQRSPSA